MSSLTIADVERIAALAHLELTDVEKPLFTRQLADILDYAAQLQAVDTEGIEPMSHALDLVQPLRADAVTETDQRAALQAGAPAVEDGLYLVPKVIE